jgi:hypothetical protein
MHRRTYDHFRTFRRRWTLDVGRRTSVEIEADAPIKRMHDRWLAGCLIGRSRDRTERASSTGLPRGPQTSTSSHPKLGTQSQTTAYNRYNKHCHAGSETGRMAALYTLQLNPPHPPLSRRWCHRAGYVEGTVQYKEQRLVWRKRD